MRLTYAAVNERDAQEDGDSFEARRLQFDSAARPKVEAIPLRRLHSQHSMTLTSQP